jgi:hypothetical protein
MTLSELASRVHAQLVALDECYEDARRWHAPGECYDVARGAARWRIGRLFKEAGTDAERFFDEVERRTTGKFAHERFGYVLELMRGGVR